MSKTNVKISEIVNKIKNNLKTASSEKTDANFVINNATKYEQKFENSISKVQLEKEKLMQERAKIQEEYKDVQSVNKQEQVTLMNSDKDIEFVSVVNESGKAKKTITMDDITKALNKNSKKTIKTKKKLVLPKIDLSKFKNNLIDKIKIELPKKKATNVEKTKASNKKRKNFLLEFIKSVRESGKKNKKSKTKEKINFTKVKELFEPYFNTDTTIFVAFIVLFLFLLVSMLLPGPKSVSSRVLSNLVDSEKMEGIEKIKTDIENSIITKFPWYEEILDGYFGAMEASNKKLYENANDNELILIDTKNGIYIDRNEDQLIRKYEVEEKDQDIEIEHRIKLFNAMANLLQRNKVNAYIYAVSGIWTSEAILNFELDYKEPLKYVKMFEESISDYIHFDYLKIIDYTTFKKYFFATDHHWRIHGAYEGYRDICKMFGISEKEMVPENFFKVDGVEFMGSNAKVCSYDNIVDYLYDIDFDGECEVEVNGETVDISELTKKDEYLKGEFEKEDTYYNHYGKYFHSDLGKIVYTYHNNKKEKDEDDKIVLIISDSYSNCIDRIIASHFYKTYVIDLRYYKDATGEKFILEDFVEENNITDVLVMLSANSVYFESADLDLGIEGVSGVKENREK